MSDALRRTKRLEAQVRKLPVSENEQRAAEERHRCRYTLILEMKRYVMHGLWTARGIELPPHEPFHPQGESLERIRAHGERWHLPVVSEKPPEEAQAYLGSDSPERARQDAKIVGWSTWVEGTYIPALEAMAKAEETEDPSQLLEWVRRTVEAEAKEDRARANPDDYDRVMQRVLAIKKGAAASKKRAAAKKKRAADKRTRGEGGKSQDG